MDRIAELVASLSAEGFSSPYLDRLRKRSPSPRRGDALSALRQEILGEMAASLGRAEDRINAALLVLDVIGRQLGRLRQATGDRPGDARRLREQVEAFNDQREVAKRRLWELTVQREALGLRNHDRLDEFFTIPPRASTR